MTKTLSAVYENGVLRPSEPLDLKESQRVTVIISDAPGDIADAYLDHEYMAAIDAMDETAPTLEEVRAALATIPGNLSDDIRAERDARG
ncbi:MAG: antitoxin family protein [Acidobacteria bacterium]|nr:antitoxin family protein [Acidobacteriota bacterium]